MFELVEGCIARRMREDGEILFVPANKASRDNTVTYHHMTPDGVNIVYYVFHCEITNTATAFIIDHLAIHEDMYKPWTKGMHFLLLQLVLEEAIQMAKEKDKRTVIVSSDLEMIPEVAMEYGFAVLTSLGPTNGKYFCMKRLKG